MCVAVFDSRTLERPLGHRNVSVMNSMIDALTAAGSGQQQENKKGKEKTQTLTVHTALLFKEEFNVW